MFEELQPNDLIAAIENLRRGLDITVGETSGPNFACGTLRIQFLEQATAAAYKKGIDVSAIPGTDWLGIYYEMVE